jgi:transposase
VKGRKIHALVDSEGLPMRVVVHSAAKVPLLRVEIVKRRDDMKGFAVLPHHWVVERTFSWFGHTRRLAKDFENLAETLAAFVTPVPSSSLSGGLPGRSS